MYKLHFEVLNMKPELENSSQNIGVNLYMYICILCISGFEGGNLGEFPNRPIDVKKRYHIIYLLESGHHTKLKGNKYNFSSRRLTNSSK